MRNAEDNETSGGRRHDSDSQVCPFCKQEAAIASELSSPFHVHRCSLDKSILVLTNRVLRSLLQCIKPSGIYGIETDFS
jgi:wobble nucleotide-excising tRNase